MRKALFFVLATFVLNSIQAQDENVLMSKNGHPILPAAGDIGLGFDAAPLLNFALNAIKIGANSGQQAQHPSYVPGMNQVIVGKYFLKDDLAARIRFGFNTLRETEKIYGDNPLTPSDPNPENILISKTSVSESSHFIGLGLEKRRGYNRLDGIYGAEILVGYQSEKVTNKYEIEYNQTAQDSGAISPNANRLLTSKDAGSFTFGIRGFLGVEYFVAPKISVGAEFGWGVGLVTGSRGYVEREFWGIPPGSSSSERQSYIERFEGNSSESELSISVDNGISNILGSSAALSMHFHF